MIRKIVMSAAIILLLAGCSNNSSRTPQAVDLNGIWGGVLTMSGQDFAVFAMDVSTSVSGSSGTVSGYGIMRPVSGTAGDVYVSVSGSTGSGSLALVLTDGVGDSLRLNGNQSGQRVDGNWTFTAGGVSGTFRMAREDNIDLLGTSSTDSRAGTLLDLLTH